MTSSTTNEQIALELGWTKLDQGDTWFINPLGQWRKHVPDYEHDWAHAGPLWAELVKELTLPGAANYVWKMLAAGVGWCPSQDELMVATCDAWLAWKKSP